MNDEEWLKREMYNNAFRDGQRDCEKGLAPQSDYGPYLEGYGAQYAAEQAVTALGIYIQDMEQELWGVKHGRQ